MEQKRVPAARRVSDTRLAFGAAKGASRLRPPKGSLLQHRGARFQSCAAPKPANGASRLRPPKGSLLQHRGARFQSCTAPKPVKDARVQGGKTRCRRGFGDAAPRTALKHCHRTPEGGNASRRGRKISSTHLACNATKDALRPVNGASRPAWGSLPDLIAGRAPPACERGSAAQRDGFSLRGPFP